MDEVTTSESTSRKYELMFILSPMLTEDKRTATVKELEDIIKSFKGDVFHTEDWGKRRLAYRIKKQDEGYYLIYYFTSDDQKLIDELEHHLKLDQGVLRHLLMRREHDYEIVDYLQVAEQGKKEKAGKVSAKGIDESLRRAPKKAAPAPKKTEDGMKEVPAEKPAKQESAPKDELDKKLMDIISDSDIEI